MSRIFTKAEMEEINRQKSKNYGDKFGLFSSRVKPKIIELLNIWFPKKQELKKLIKSKRKNDN